MISSLCKKLCSCCYSPPKKKGAQQGIRCPEVYISDYNSHLASHPTLAWIDESVKGVYDNADFTSYVERRYSISEQKLETKEIEESVSRIFTGTVEPEEKTPIINKEEE